MKNTPLFTVVIANYNHGKYLNSALDSLVNQDYQNFELFVIDAKSTDNSLEIIKKFEDRIDWWISEPDSGQSDAFNKGFKKANGQFLFWLNADDVLLPNSLSIAFDYIGKYPDFSWFAANTVFFDVNNIITKCTNGPSWSDLLFDKGPINIYGPSSIFSKKIFDEVGGFDENLHYTMDTDLWMRFQKKGYKFKRIHQYFWGFRIHSDSKTSHVFTEEPIPAFFEERKRILIKNEVVYSRITIFGQKLYKIFSGLYMMSYIDTMRNRGNLIKNLKF